MIIPTTARLVLASALLCALAAPANAQGQSDDWEIVLAPYLWGVSMQGTSTVGMLPPLDLDVSFSDIVSNLNMALSLHTEFKKGNWVFVIDPT